MTRRFISFPIADFQQTRLQMLSWGDQFNICCFLDNHQYDFSHHSIECILAAGSLRQVTAVAGNALNSLNAFLHDETDWVFGHLGYDLKNEIELLDSSNFDGIGFPDLFFYVPEIVIQLTKTELIIGVGDISHDAIVKQIQAMPVRNKTAVPDGPVEISNRFSREDYLHTIDHLKQHILRGDCYEINFCQEFFALNATIDPLELYRALSRSSPNPFSAYYKLNDKYLICLSPERYLKRSGDTIISQPIKGTAKREPGDIARDEINKNRLQHSEKERSENIMVVDLVRNDLSRISKKGTVKVDELCVIYSFPQVYQMISTVSGELEEGIGFTDAVKASFPMGSMTGAPKKKVMQLIEQYERTKRGLFSGSLGYISPGGDFDFNVVIRSVLFNEATKYLSFHAGSAITFNSNAAEEYEECLLKAEAIKKVLVGDQYL